jgi:hypothetical protein
MRHTNAKLVALSIIGLGSILLCNSPLLKEHASAQVRALIPYMHVASATPADTTLNWVGTVVKISSADRAEIDCNMDGISDFEVMLPPKKEFFPGNKVFGTAHLPLRNLSTDAPLVVAKL